MRDVPWRLFYDDDDDAPKHRYLNNSTVVVLEVASKTNQYLNI